MEKDINLIYHYRDLEKNSSRSRKTTEKIQHPSQNPNPQSGVPPQFQEWLNPFPNRLKLRLPQDQVPLLYD